VVPDRLTKSTQIPTRKTFPDFVLARGFGEDVVLVAARVAPFLDLEAHHHVVRA